MSQEPQAEIGARLDEPAVVEFGADEPVRKRPRAGQIFAAVRRDWRLVPVVAGLSAVATFASLIGEWQTTTVTQPELFFTGQAMQPVTAGVADLNGYSTGYLIGVFLLVGCMALVLFGRPALRDQLRVLGLTVAGVLAAILISTTMWLDENSAGFGTGTIFIGSPGPAYELTFGRGLTMAYLGVAGFAIALYLAGRLMPAPLVQPSASPAETAAEPGPQADGAEPVDWPWRRPRAPQESEELDGDLPPPADLTVAPTTPFVPMHDGKPPAPNGKDSP